MSKAKNLATFGDNVDSSGNITDLNVDSNTLVVDAVNNRVGIGTNAPTTKLDVNGAITVNNQNDIFLNGGDVILSTGSQVTMSDDSTRDKYRVWDWYEYAIGMTNGNTFGGLNNDFAMTFNMANDNDTGFWWGDSAQTNAQGAMALTTNGKLTVAHSVRIGYGEDDTTTPGATHTLDVNGVIRQQLTDSTNLWTDISSGANNYTPMSNELVIQNDALDVTNSMASIFFQPGQTTSGLQINSARIAAVREAGFDTSLAFSTREQSAGHTEKMRITSGGDVGIGTSSPSAPLDVAGNIFISADTTESVRLSIGNGRSGDGYSYVDLVGDATYTEYGLRMIRNNTGANATSDIYHRGTGALRISAQDAGSVQLRTNSTNRFQVDSTGRIQMVTSNLLTDGEGSNFNVSINGYVGVSSSLVAGVGTGAVGLSLNDGYGNANLTFNHHSGTPDVTGNSLRITTNVDGTTGAQMAFQGKSTTTAGAAVSLNTMAIMYADTANMTIYGTLTQSSDLRIKKDLQIIPDALDKVKTLNGYTYTRTDRDFEFQQTGCVAQEVQAVLPEAVVTGEDEQQTLSIAYGSMVGLLVEAIKELEAKVAALESGA